MGIPVSRRTQAPNIAALGSISLGDTEQVDTRDFSLASPPMQPQTLEGANSANLLQISSLPSLMCLNSHMTSVTIDVTA